MKYLALPFFLFSLLLPAQNSEQCIYADPVMVYQSSSDTVRYTKRPYLFYAPHQDDEVLGMGGAIATAVKNGHPVFVVLISDGRNKMQLKIMQDQGLPVKTLEDQIAARNREFLACTRALGVNRVYIANNGKGFNDELFAPQYNECRSCVEKTLTWAEYKFPGAVHNLVSGACDVYDTRGHTNVTHKACSEAAIRMSHLLNEIRFYRVYVYRLPAAIRGGNAVPLPSDIFNLKRRAMLWYHRNVQLGLYGVGWDISVSSLFEAAYSIPYEYVDELSDTCQGHP